jgi:hypothetical protein
MTIEKDTENTLLATSFIFHDDAFSRLDESDDSEFYARERFVHHLDSLALSTVETLIGTLVVEESPAILDLMAGWDSHIPGNLRPREVVGLGLNENELRGNKALSETVLHDLNKDPHLPFRDNRFDVIVNTEKGDKGHTALSILSGENA